MLEDNPLKAKPRKKKGEKTQPPANETPEEKAMRIMEESFTVYDWSKVNRDAPTVLPDEVVDLCEKGVHITVEKEKPDKTSQVQ